MNYIPSITKKYFCLFFLLCASSALSAQISYGGKPIPLSSGMRTSDVNRHFFVEMSSVNNMEELRKADIEDTKFRSLTFAHKFYVHLRPDNSGENFMGPDGANVWRVGIRSKGAFSLNILFTKFRLPKGAKVFVYNADQTEILGSYTHENNTDLNLLPIQPIAGDELIVEYHEPIGAAFKGEIEVGEVNHDFRGLFRATEPRDPVQSCHPNIVCYPEDMDAGRGVVTLIINGKTYCTGSLVNNTAEDATPYLLTATHCLNSDYNPSFLANRKYDVVAGTIVAFFNYNSPVCPKDIRGPLQMTLASADSVLINEKHDVSLLRFKQKPPVSYQPYYLGWNISNSPIGAFHGIHHPNGGVKKVAVENDPLTVTSFGVNPPYNMNPNVHWAVNAWDVGATEGGSSGSPLLDRGKRIVGTLTGGESFCEGAKGPDVYAALTKAWTSAETLQNPRTLKDYLDAKNTSATQLGGYNPYLKQPYTRIRNFDTNETPTQSYVNSIPFFATNNTLGYTEFGEEFNLSEDTRLEGVFISSPVIKNMADMNIVIKVYAGMDNPQTLLHEESFTYSYRYYGMNSFHSAPRDMRHTVENYIAFSKPINVPKNFYITYVETNGIPGGFSVMNTEPRKENSGKLCKTWIKNAQGWIKSDRLINNPIHTSLLISPYIIAKDAQNIDPDAQDMQVQAYYNAEVKRIFIKSNKEILKWEIFYVTGQKMHEASEDDASVMQTSYPAGHFTQGMYIVRVTTAMGQRSVKILVR